MKLFTPRRILAATLATGFVGLSATAIAQGMGPGAFAHELHAQLMAQTSAPSGPAAEPRQARRDEHRPQRDARQSQRMERLQARQAQRQAQLKQALQLRPEQEPAWLAFVARTAPTARPDRSMNRADHTAWTTPERLEHMQAQLAQRHAEMTRRIEATRSFYTALSPEQQQVFDAQRLGGFQRASSDDRHGPKGHHGHGGMHRMGGKDGQRPQQKSGDCETRPTPRT